MRSPLNFMVSLALCLCLSAFAAAQTQKDMPQSDQPAKSTAMKSTTKTDMALQEQLFNVDKKLWEAWKNKDVKTFDRTLASNAILVFPDGVSDRAQTLKDIGSQNCQVRSFNLSDPNITRVDKDAVLLTYKGQQDATCDGQKLPDNVYASTLFVKKEGEWKPVFHQESAAMPENTSSTMNK